MLQTKSLISGKFRTYLEEPDKTNILQWAVGRSVPKDIQAILNALTDEQERYILITHCPDHDDLSPLLLTAANCAKDNLIMMVNALSHEHVMEAILPEKVTFLTPLNDLYSAQRKELIVPVLLNKLFGKNQKLYDAYHYLEDRTDRKKLEDMRDYYLATHFPSSIQKTFSFFKPGFSIPGHKLSNEELDKVVRVVFYQRYDKFDYVERGKIEARMNEYKSSEKVGTLVCS